MRRKMLRTVITHLIAGGKLKRFYRLFREVNDALYGLKQKLKQNEQLREQIEQAREE